MRGLPGVKLRDGRASCVQRPPEQLVIWHMTGCSGGLCCRAETCLRHAWQGSGQSYLMCPWRESPRRLAGRIDVLPGNATGRTARMLSCQGQPRYRVQYSLTVSERLTREHEHVFSWPCSRIGANNTCATVPQRIAIACTVPLRC